MTPTMRALLRCCFDVGPRPEASAPASSQRAARPFFWQLRHRVTRFSGAAPRTRGARLSNVVMREAYSHEVAARILAGGGATDYAPSILRLSRTRRLPYIACRAGREVYKAARRVLLPYEAVRPRRIRCGLLASFTSTYAAAPMRQWDLCARMRSAVPRGRARLRVAFGARPISEALRAPPPRSRIPAAPALLLGARQGAGRIGALLGELAAAEDRLS